MQPYKAWWVQLASELSPSNPYRQKKFLSSATIGVSLLLEHHRGHLEVSAGPRCKLFTAPSHPGPQNTSPLCTTLHCEQPVKPLFPLPRTNPASLSLGIPTPTSNEARKQASFQKTDHGSTFPPALQQPPCCLARQEKARQTEGFSLQKLRRTKIQRKRYSKKQASMCTL